MLRFWKILVLMSFLIIADQMTKGVVQSSFALGESLTLIDQFFHFTYVINRGAAWSMASDAHPWIRTILLLIVPVLMCGFLSYLLVKSLKGPWYASYGLGLILAGAVGNLIDRFTLGHVVDFLDFQFGTYHYPVFNVADSCVTVGAILYGIEVLIMEPRRQKLQLAKK
jgi:signal peptidase II